MGDSCAEQSDDEATSVLDDAYLTGRDDPSDSNMQLDIYIGGQNSNSMELGPVLPTQSVSTVDDHAPGPRKCEKCWLCTFCTNPLAVNLQAFASENVSSMDFEYMAAQIRSQILSEYPRADGVGVNDIMRHLQQHMISPKIKMAATIQSLLMVAETLQMGLQHRDPETDEVLVDTKNTELYLKVIAQIMAAYKMDSSKLMFQM